MIVGELKPFTEIENMLQGAKRIMVIGCGGCVTVCQTGGAREANTLAQLLSLGKGIEAKSFTVPRQCEWEFLDQIAPEFEQTEIIVSTACGIGVQAMNRRYPHIQTIPALNTVFLGMPVDHGDFREWCQACGDCMLSLTGGICPVARCSKNLMNGPCGGSQNGKCEILGEIECAWQLIYDRLKVLNRLDDLMEITPPKDWSKSRDGGPRSMVRRDLLLYEPE